MQKSQKSTNFATLIIHYSRNETSYLTFYMIKYTPIYTDITSWVQCQFFQTGGTRAKCWVLNPFDNNRYFFKISLKKQVIDYHSEFWMEIIASKLGQSLGLRMLDYNIAKQENLIGCISKNMCEDCFELVETTRILSGFDETYNPASKKDQVRYTFNFLYEALKSKNLHNQVDKFIEVLVFDTIIGNQDRHQDNWGFIKPTSNEVVVEKKSIFFWRKKSLKIVNSWDVAKFSPIYDSGSCLGHELTEEKVSQMLKNEMQLNAYVRRGKPELRWVDKKLSYYELLNCLLQDNRFKQLTRAVIKRILEKFNSSIFAEIVHNIDNAIPESEYEFKLSDNRKKLVIQLTNKRISLLRELLNNDI